MCQWFIVKAWKWKQYGHFDNHSWTFEILPSCVLHMEIYWMIAQTSGKILQSYTYVKRTFPYQVIK